MEVTCTKDGPVAIRPDLGARKAQCPKCRKYRFVRCRCLNGHETWAEIDPNVSSINVTDICPVCGQTNYGLGHEALRQWWKDQSDPLKEMSGDELSRAMHREQMATLTTIKNAMIFFVVLAVVGICLGIWVGIQAGKQATRTYYP